MNVNTAKSQKSDLLQLELDYLQLLCIKEVVDSLEVVHIKNQSAWPIKAKLWQEEVLIVIKKIMKHSVLTQLTSTKLADKFVPTGYPKETFLFICNLKESDACYANILAEYVPKRAVSEEKLLFLSNYLQSFMNDSNDLINVLCKKEKSIFLNFFKKESYFSNTLYKFLTINETNTRREK